jgi:hypothetical protein
MSYLGKIDNMPLYSTVQEALLYGKQYNITTYHTHTLNGQLGYMAGSHDTLQSAIDQGIQVFLTPEELALGYFITNNIERQAYIANNYSNIPAVSIDIEVQPQPEDQPVQQQAPVINPVQPITTQNPVVSPPSGGSGGGGY